MVLSFRCIFSECAIEERTHSDKKCQILTKNGLICAPTSLQTPAAEWHHYHLCHPGETRLELTLRQHYDWKGLRTTVQKACRACTICAEAKKKEVKFGKLPPKKNPEGIPWHTLCIDLIGEYEFGENEKKIKLRCLTMIDPATGWFEIVRVARPRADHVANALEFAWLSRCPWPTEVVLDRGNEFTREVKDMLRTDYGIKRKPITVRNPQANSIVERVHKTIHNMIRGFQIRDKDDLDPEF